MLISRAKLVHLLCHLSCIHYFKLLFYLRLLPWLTLDAKFMLNLDAERFLDAMKGNEDFEFTDAMVNILIYKPGFFLIMFHTT